MSSRQIKAKVLELLNSRDLAAVLGALQSFPAKDVVNVLFSAICREDSLVRWHAVSGMGETVARLADVDMEAARIIMRRLLWSLNDESGGIGWGAPECMAEIMCCHAGLSAEYVHMLISYMREDGEELCQDGNYIEHPLLQRGLLWGVARLSRCRPGLLLEKGAGPDILPYLEAADPEIRGLAALAVGNLRLIIAQSHLKKMLTDNSPLRVYQDGFFLETTVCRLALTAVEAMN
ncbi:MAG: HEAT repeat domain-containing protein [Desulfobulbaceae bacterium]|nr:HEAT repeat domain-containing protein [Desulfobulbaceae bacterium]